MSPFFSFARLLRLRLGRFWAFAWSMRAVSDCLGRRSVGIAMVAIAFVCPRAVSLTLPLNWRWSNPSPHGNNIVDLISTNGVAIQV
jgi:hypothetical protein